MLEEMYPEASVKDATCSGGRCFECEAPEEPGSEEEFFEAYARLLLGAQRPCMRMTTAGSRKNVDAEGRKGTVYHTIKFCDYYSFEYSDLRDRAERPLLKIETDTTPQSSGQLKTRLEAFGETLEMGRKIRSEGKAADRDGRLIVAGVDSGSTSTDVVIMDSGKNILASVIAATGMSASMSAEAALEAALEKAGLERNDLDAVIATGYGRDALEMDKDSITEITCHARGAAHLFPGTRTIIDIGGQDSKIIRIDEDGKVSNFIMNDKCAAGTGRFLEMQARALGLSMEEMSSRGLEWKEDVRISNMCTVFAESEVVSLVAKDTPLADIIHGLNRSVAEKTVSLVKRGKGEGPFAMTGGVSKNDGVVKCLEEELGEPVAISEMSQLCGAIGAALSALDDR